MSLPGGCVCKGFFSYAERISVCFVNRINNRGFNSVVNIIVAFTATGRQVNKFSKFSFRRFTLIVAYFTDCQSKVAIVQCVCCEINRFDLRAITETPVELVFRKNQRSTGIQPHINRIICDCQFGNSSVFSDEICFLSTTCGIETPTCRTNTTCRQARVTCCFNLNSKIIEVVNGNCSKFSLNILPVIFRLGCTLPCGRVLKRVVPLGKGILDCVCCGDGECSNAQCCHGQCQHNRKHSDKQSFAG